MVSGGAVGSRPMTVAPWAMKKQGGAGGARGGGASAGVPASVSAATGGGTVAIGKCVAVCEFARALFATPECTQPEWALS